MSRRRGSRALHFRGYEDFTPTLTPREMFKEGVFGGTYWRPIYSSVAKKNFKNVHKKYPTSWWKGIPEEKLSSSACNKDLNKYKVVAGASLEMWESKGWIKAPDYYGWVHWYCEFYKGRRGPDDERQIRRWKNFATRFGKRKNKTNKIKQALLQWAIDPEV